MALSFFLSKVNFFHFDTALRTDGSICRPVVLATAKLNLLAYATPKSIFYITSILIVRL